MKNIIFILLFWWTGIQVSAQTTNYRYRINYVTDHRLFLQGDAVNVVDYDLEWPEMLNGSTVIDLQKRLEKELFQQEDSTWQKARSCFEENFGKQVCGQLPFLPDDKKFCYVSCQLKELGLWKERFATFEVIVSVKPQSLSSQKEYQHQVLIVYDMINNEFLKSDQILRMNRIGGTGGDAKFSTSLLVNVEQPLSSMPSSISLGKDFGIGNQHLILPYVAFGESTDDFIVETAYVPLKQLDGYFTKDFLRRLEQTPAALSSHVEKLDSSDVFSEVDEKPSFPLEKVSFQNYLSQQIKVPALAKLEKASGRLLVSFVIAEDGTVQNVDVLQPCSPSLDREVVKQIKLMPRWKPGKNKGKVVKVRLAVPLSFKM